MKEVYVLLDFGGNIEMEAPMTADEAKKRNFHIVHHGDRFGRWVKKSVLLHILGERILNKMGRDINEYFK